MSVFDANKFNFSPSKPYPSFDAAPVSMPPPVIPGGKFTGGPTLLDEPCDIPMTDWSPEPAVVVTVAAARAFSASPPALIPTNFASTPTPMSVDSVASEYERKHAEAAPAAKPFSAMPLTPGIAAAKKFPFKAPEGLFSSHLCTNLYNDNAKLQRKLRVADRVSDKLGAKYQDLGDRYEEAVAALQDEIAENEELAAANEQLKRDNAQIAANARTIFDNCKILEARLQETSQTALSLMQENAALRQQLAAQRQHRGV